MHDGVNKFMAALLTSVIASWLLGYVLTLWGLFSFPLVRAWRLNLALQGLVWPDGEHTLIILVGPSHLRVFYVFMSLQLEKTGPQVSAAPSNHCRLSHCPKQDVGSDMAIYLINLIAVFNMSQGNIKMYQAAAKSPHSFVTFIFHVLFEKSQWEKQSRTLHLCNTP